MFYRRFGKTNLLLSAFSLGTMRCLASEAVMEETVHQAIALGINHIETARGYGKSELYLGNILQKLDRKNFYITSKICPTETAEQMRSQIDESLTRLQIDSLDCLAIHGINTEEHLKLITDPNGCLKAIREALEIGKIRHLGFSTHGSLELIIKTIQTDSTILVTAFFVKNYKSPEKPYEGHFKHSELSFELKEISYSLKPGDILIPTKQKSANFIHSVMQPSAEDSYFSWNFFDSYLQEKEYFSNYVFVDKIAEILESNPQLKNEYIERKKNNESFRNSEWEQLYFIYSKSKYFEPSFMRLPIFQVLNRK